MVARASLAFTVLALTSVLQLCRGTEPSVDERPSADKRAEPKPEPVAVSDRCAAPRTTWYLHLSDVHFGENISEQTASSDTGEALWTATKQQIERVVNGPNPPLFVLYTGDLPNHTPDHGDVHTKNIQAVLADFQQLFGKTKFLYLPGNNDSLDWDYATFTDAAGQTPLSASGWATPTLNVEIADPGKPEHGYYSASVAPGLRVVALNTVMFSAHYPCHGESSCTVGSQDADVDAQLDWLERQLAAAASSEQRVLLAMHVPPGLDAYAVSEGKTGLMWKQPAWQNRFLALVDASPAKLAGLAFGHTHMDELRLLHDEAGNVDLLGLCSPGITPGHDNNPGFKAVSIDANFEAVDVLTWYASATSDGDGLSYEFLADNCYRYADADVFGCNGGSLRECLAGKSIDDVAAGLAKVYGVKSPKLFTPDYVKPGIDVVRIP